MGSANERSDQARPEGWLLRITQPRGGKLGERSRATRASRLRSFAPFHPEWRVTTWGTAADHPLARCRLRGIPCHNSECANPARGRGSDLTGGWPRNIRSQGEPAKRLDRRRRGSGSLAVERV